MVLGTGGPADERNAVGCEQAPELVVHLAVAWHDEGDARRLGPIDIGLPVHASILPMVRGIDYTTPAPTTTRDSAGS